MPRRASRDWPVHLGAFVNCRPGAVLPCIDFCAGMCAGSGAGLFVEDTRSCCSGMRGDAIAKIKEEGRAAARGTRSNCVPPRPTAIPTSVEADLRS